MVGDTPVANTYARQPIALVKGRGAVVWDSEGREYIDCFSGLAVLNTGHSHPRVVEAICRQAGEIMHTSNVYRILPQEELAELLFEVSGGYKSFFCNSGAEANEAAIKLARKHTGRPGVIAAKNSFHGRTLATLAATGQEKYKRDFQPLPREFTHVEYGDLDALEAAVTGETGAVLLEPIQGEGGVVVPPDGYLEGVRQLCDEKGILLILDEVQTGFGRTGTMFAWQGLGVEPDIFTVAKAIAGGFPMGAMLARPGVMDSFAPGDHASTFGGNHLACAAARAAVEVLIEERLAERARDLGRYFIDALEGLKARHRVVREVRGRGLMIGMELTVPGQNLVDAAREEGVLINCTHDTVLRFLPPLVIERAQLDRVVAVLDRILEGTEDG
ncbi:MAG: acetylornithine transaminase [Euryarchaeota archaeon]|nr:acetylornithine transaminase [Euryarchaeota archaeon]